VDLDHVEDTSGSSQSEASEDVNTKLFDTVARDFLLSFGLSTEDVYEEAAGGHFLIAQGLNNTLPHSHHP